MIDGRRYARQIPRMRPPTMGKIISRWWCCQWAREKSSAKTSTILPSPDAAPKALAYSLRGSARKLIQAARSCLASGPSERYHWSPSSEIPHATAGWHTVWDAVWDTAYTMFQVPFSCIVTKARTHKVASSCILASEKSKLVSPIAVAELPCTRSASCRTSCCRLSGLPTLQRLQNTKVLMRCFFGGLLYLIGAKFRFLQNLSVLRPDLI